uniref:Uncharacterized protein n=1 Tax=Sinocyclocheilus anshuiensis TaxID=1608454 RepID=A0A671Q1H9_9TELE
TQSGSWKIYCGSGTKLTVESSK